MNTETFKIYCRAYFPNCTFEENPFYVEVHNEGFLIAYMGKGSEVISCLEIVKVRKEFKKVIKNYLYKREFLKALSKMSMQKVNSRKLEDKIQHLQGLAEFQDGRKCLAVPRWLIIEALDYIKELESKA